MSIISLQSHIPNQPSSYQVWKAARLQLLELSGGHFELAGNSYRGDQVRHRIIHKECGGHFWASIQEVEAYGSDLCPYCNIPRDLSVFGNMQAVQLFVSKASFGGAYFFAGNKLGAPDAYYQFQCLRHQIAYQPTFTDWWNNRGESNGCPECLQRIRKRHTGCEDFDGSELARPP